MRAIWLDNCDSAALRATLTRVIAGYRHCLAVALECNTIFGNNVLKGAARNATGLCLESLLVVVDAANVVGMILHRELACRVLLTECPINSQRSV